MNIADLLKDPQEKGLVEQLLSQRAEPDFADWRQSVAASQNGGFTSPQDIADKRQYGIADQLSKIERMRQEQSQFELNQQLKQAQIRSANALATRRSSGGGGGGSPVPNFGKAPAGYQWTPDGRLAAIEGGPATKVPSELAARLGLAYKSLEELPGIQEKVQQGAATGAWDYAVGAMGLGESGAIQRRIADGADALQRMLTGAGMPQSEAEDYANRFRVTWRDNSSTLNDKLSNLQAVLKAQEKVAMQGHLTAGQMPGASGLPSAANNQSGDDSDLLQYMTPEERALFGG